VFNILSRVSTHNTLPFFFVGSKYPPNTIYNIVIAIQRHLREECKRPEINFLARNNYTFSEFLSTLDAVMKTLTAEGLGVVRHTDNLCIDDEIKLWELGVINTTSAEGLSYGVFFYNCKVFGFRGLTEHKQLTADQYTVRYNYVGNPVLMYQEHVSKTTKGGLNERKYSPKTVTQYSDPTNPRCVVGLFAKYFSCIPKSGPFYRRPLPPTKVGCSIFSSQVIGMNTLGKYLQNMFNDANIDRKVVNHSGRVYCCSTLYNSGFEEQEVMQRSGHKSTAVRNYKRPSESKLQDISNALQPPAPKISSGEKENMCPSTVIKSETTSVSTPCSISAPGTTLSTLCHNRIKSPTENELRIIIPKCINTVVLVQDGKEIKLSF